MAAYSFLFPAERDLNKAHQLRGGLTPSQLTLSFQGGPTLQLAAERIALNLRDSGLNVQVIAGAQRGDLNLRAFALESRDPQSALESLLRSEDQAIPISDASPASLYKLEHGFLDRKTL